MNWIKLSEQKPKDGQECFCYQKTELLGDEFYILYFYEKYDHINTTIYNLFWDVDWDRGDKCYKNIEYWYPCESPR